jgi:hypothetical protein
MDFILNQVANYAPLFCAFEPDIDMIYCLPREIGLFEAAAGSHF